MFFSTSVTVSPKCHLFWLLYREGGDSEMHSYCSGSDRVHMLMKSDNRVFPGALCSGSHVILEFLEHAKLRKKIVFFTSPRQKVEVSHGPWHWVGEFGECLFQDRLVFWLNKSGLEASSSPDKTDGGKGTKKTGDLHSLHQIGISLPENQISSVDFLCDISF